MQKAPTLAQLKKELETLPHNALVALVTKLGKFTTLNKQLITYQLFDAQNPGQFMLDLKEDITDKLIGADNLTWYNQKKFFRKFNKETNNYKKIIGNKELELQMQLIIAEIIGNELKKQSGNINYIMATYYDKVKIAIVKLIGAIHEDLKFDYVKQYQLLD